MRQAELLTTDELADRYKFPSRKAARQWLQRHPAVPRKYRGRIVLVDARDMDAAIRRKAS